VGAIIAKGRPQARTVAFVAAAASLAHLLAGRWDWFSRYGIYIMATAFAGLLIVWGPIIGTQARHITTPSLLIFVLPFVGYTYLIDTLVTPPRASQNIYDQQYQMHLFAVEYFPEPVAVIGLCWMTYRSDE
jgi:hypothetical protein